MADTDPAVTAAAEAIRAAIRSDEDYAGGPTALSRVAVAAARPIIEAEAAAKERERIAAEIEARIEPPDETPCVNGPGCPECIDGRALRHAARIARGNP